MFTFFHVAARREADKRSKDAKKQIEKMTQQIKNFQVKLFFYNFWLSSLLRLIHERQWTIKTKIPMVTLR